MPAINGTLDVIRSVRPELAGLHILDIGCGSGALAKQLVDAGAIVFGIDPLPEAVRAASAAAPQGVFMTAVAEELPFEAQAFDLAVMANALHHVPETAMRAALREAVRVTSPKGALIVIEPLASGSFFAALQPIEDETAVRRAAQLAVEAAISDGEVVRTESFGYTRKEVFRSIDEFFVRIVAVEPSRRAVIDSDRPSITEMVLAAAERDSRGNLIFEQPIRVDVLSVSASG